MYRKLSNINLNKDGVHLCTWSSSAEKALEVLTDTEPAEGQAAKANKLILK